jgi:bifunctional non-homologous end joining protein LigD
VGRRGSTRSYEIGDIVIECTNVDRIVFPDDGITKGDLIDYYRDIAEAILPELHDRPLTLERFTKGLAGGGFYQKHAQKHFPNWIERAVLGQKTVVEYPICDSTAALVYFANQGAIALHVWTSRRGVPDRPDVIVFDLDPPDGRFDLVRRAARILYELLGELGLSAFVKTTGSKGLHVIAPLDGSAAFDAVMTLCNRIARLVCARHPDELTIEFYKKDRKGRLFVDVMRNALGATFVAAYSVRGRRGAPVSAPIAWAEVDDPKLRADAITLRDIRARVERGDPWAKLRAKEGSVAAAARALDELERSAPTKS